MNEDQILDQVELERHLAKLHPADREMILLVFRIYRPPDWCGGWPPKYDEIGYYIGVKYESAPLSEAAIRYRRDVVLARWRGERGELRRMAKKSPRNRRKRRR